MNWSHFGGALVGVFWAYHGWMNIAPVAEEVKNPQRNIPFALLSGVGVIILLYLGVNLAYYLMMPGREIAELTDRTVVGEFGYRILGSTGLLFASAAVMISVFGALNGNLLVGPRLLYAMGQDGLAPRALSRLHPRYATPALAIAVLAGWSIVLVLVVGALTAWRLQLLNIGGISIDFNLPEGKPPFDVITDFAMFGALSFETSAVASIFVFRRRFPVRSVKLPYRCPLFPVVPILYVTALAAVLTNMFRSQHAGGNDGRGIHPRRSLRLRHDFAALANERGDSSLAEVISPGPCAMLPSARGLDQSAPTRLRLPRALGGHGPFPRLEGQG